MHLPGAAVFLVTFLVPERPTCKQTDEYEGHAQKENPAFHVRSPANNRSKEYCADNGVNFGKYATENATTGSVTPGLKRGAQLAGNLSSMD
jgi:hypothetical protein